ncbi:hypothetical protein ACVWW4_003982 [Bradyrhizobium sp. LB7.1]
MRGFFQFLKAGSHRPRSRLGLNRLFGTAKSHDEHTKSHSGLARDAGGGAVLTIVARPPSLLYIASHQLECLSLPLPSSPDGSATRASASGHRNALYGQTRASERRSLMISNPMPVNWTSRAERALQPCSAMAWFCAWKIPMPHAFRFSARGFHLRVFRSSLNYVGLPACSRYLRAHFDFLSDKLNRARAAVLIGRNGTGKTHLCSGSSTFSNDPEL